MSEAYESVEGEKENSQFLWDFVENYPELKVKLSTMVIAQEKLEGTMALHVREHSKLPKACQKSRIDSKYEHNRLGIFVRSRCLAF